MSLKQIIKKIKGFYNNHFLITIWLFIFVLVIADSYILGTLSKYQTQASDLEIVQDNLFKISKKDLIEHQAGESGGGDVIASKNGSKYYYIWCSGVDRIKDENRVYFLNEEEAKKEGYEIAKNCQ